MKRLLNTRLVLIILALMAQGVCHAATWYVNYNSGRDQTNYGKSSSSPNKKIGYVLSRCSAGDVIYVMYTEPISSNTTLTGPDGGVTIQRYTTFNGKNTTTAAGDRYIFNVTGGTLTLSNVKMQGNEFTDDNYTNIWDRTLIYVNGGSVVLNSGTTLTGNKTNPAKSHRAPAVYINNGNLTMNSGSEISNCSARQCGAIELVKGNMTMNDGSSIHDCESKNFDAGAVEIIATSNADESSFTMNGGEIYNCKALRFGGALSINTTTRTNSTITLNGGKIHNCQVGPYYNAGVLTYGHGGAIYSNATQSQSKVTITLDGAEIYDNLAVRFGGAMHIGSNTTLTFKSGYVHGNKAQPETGPGTTAVTDKGAGAFHVTTSGVFTMEGGTVENNFTTGNGGMMHSSYNGTILIKGGTIRNNQAYGNGGAFSLNTGCNLEISGGTTISGNKAANGGAVIVDGATVKVLGGTITGNRAALASGVTGLAEYGLGGFLELTMKTSGKAEALVAAKATIEGGEISGNTAQLSGGAIYLHEKVEGYISDGRPGIEVTGGTISGNTAEGKDGGAFYIGKGDLSVSGGTMSSNKATNGNGGLCYIDGGDVTISKGTIKQNESEKGGAVYINKITDGGVDRGSLTIQPASSSSDILIDGNKASVDGGAFYVNGGNVTLKGGIVRYNAATASNGGAFYLANGSVAVGKDGIETQLYGNSAGASGGAFYIAGLTADLPIINVTVGKLGGVDANVASNGNGGAFFIDMSGASHSVKISKSTIEGNFARKTSGTNGNGGAFYVSRGNVELNVVNLLSNSCDADGGALYVNQGNVDLIGPVLSKNTSGQNGGAIYVNAGTMSFEDGKIDSNTATSGDGGAVYMNNNGTLTFAKGDILSNTGRNGAGVFMAGGEITIEEGNVLKNTASSNGGGIFVNGGNMTFKKGNISANSALNGGGVYLGSGACLTFNGGIIMKNTALTKSPDSSLSKTAFNGGDGGLLEGLGGGIYMKKGTSSAYPTTLKFSLGDRKTFGLYNNTASYGGDDIVAEGSNDENLTNVVLPDVAELSLEGFDGQGANPNWYEDYITDDTAYAKGINKVPGGLVKRFDTMMSEPSSEYRHHRLTAAELEPIKGKYICLKLGYEMLDLTIIVTGIVGDECPLFTIVRHISADESSNVKYGILFDADKDGGDSGADGVKQLEKSSTKTLFNMPWGQYDIIPDDNWNWAYEKIEPILNRRIGDDREVTITIPVRHKENSRTPLHEEKNISL